MLSGRLHLERLVVGARLERDALGRDALLDLVDGALGLSLRPCVISQRGLSGIVRRSKMMMSPITGPMKKPSRQPMFWGTC